MHYLGSKARHAAEVIAITTAGRRPDQIYVEPFVGGGNVIWRVPQGAGRIANDKNYAMVALLDSVGNKDWLPPETMTESEWKKIMKWKPEKLEQQEALALFAFAATGPTFGSIWCGGWARDEAGSEKGKSLPQGTRYRQARDAAIREAPGLKGIEFHSGLYDAFKIPPGSLVYCDPPYANTTEYEGAKTTIKVDEKSTNNWSAAKFWRWCDKLIDEHGCTVFVSEYTGPSPGAFPPVRTEEWKARRAEACVARNALNDAPHTAEANAQIEAANQVIFGIDDELHQQGAALASRWKVVWEKEVSVNIAAGSVDTDKGESAKKETEKLFTRSA